MSQNGVLKAQRSGALDLFRFLAVLVVFFAHYTDTFNYVYKIVPENLKWSPVSRYGSSALLVFFMVSGYVVTMTSMKRNIKDFLITRLSRIYPLFWVSCIIAFILPRIIHFHTYLMYSSFKNFMVNMTMMPQIFGYDMINPVFHTLLIELAFYFFIALIILFRLWSKILVIISVLLVLCVIHSQNTTPSVYIFIPPFIGGMLFYFIKIQYRSNWKLYGLLAVNFFCTLALDGAMIKIMGAFYKNPIALNIWVIYAIITIIYIVFYLVIIKKTIIKSTAITQILGEIAYPFYLFHVYFLFLYWYLRDSVQADLLLILMLSIVLVISWVLNVMVEKPLSRLANQTLVSICRYF